jgi:hypothetical protein
MGLIGCLPFVGKLQHESRFAAARKVFCEELSDDADLRNAYRANIAMAIYDKSCLTCQSCNKLADEIVHRIFDIPKP